VKRARRSAATSGTSSCGTPNAAAIASRVRSSSVPPSPPVTSRKSTRGASLRTNSATASISSGSAAVIRTATPSGASRFASHEAFVFGTSPETSSFPIVTIEAVAAAVTQRRYFAVVEQRVSLVTLGVADLARARRFYEALGWTTGAQPADDVVFFQAGGTIVGLWSREQLAEDSGAEDSGGWGGITLAHNVRSPAEVDAVLAEAERAGGTVVRPGAETFWGGYSGLFADPDGHRWEIAHNPHWTLADDGSISL
jgi:uncharacterized protein